MVIVVTEEVEDIVVLAEDNAKDAGDEFRIFVLFSLSA